MAVEHLSREEIRKFTTASNGRGAWELAATYGIIIGAFAMVAIWPSVGTAAIAVLLLGGRQLALAVLAHECAHRSLFRSRGWNDFVGRWLCAAPVWARLDDYRVHHMGHHTRTGTADDPDLGLVAPFPCSRRSLIRKFMRDVTGVAGVRRAGALLMMDLGRLTYTASVNARWVDPPPSAAQQARGLLRYLGPTLLAQVVLVGVLAAFGVAHLYGLWVLAWFTSYGFFLRVRAIAEHACTEETPDFLRNTRTVYATPLARLFVAPHHVNYHIEHHLLMTAPCYLLKPLHETLKARGALDHSPLAPSYPAILRQVSTLPAGAAG